MLKEEQIAIEVLKEHFNNEMSIGVYPKSIKTFKPTHSKGHILVTFVNESPTGFSKETTTLKYVVTIVYKTIGSQQDVYLIIDRIRQAMHSKGFKYTGSQFTDLVDDSHWIYHNYYEMPRIFNYEG